MDLTIKITESTKNVLQIIGDILVDSQISVFEGIITTVKQKRLVMSINKMYVLI
jgi:CRISPR/Cas system-associated endoribonuclease Cas2